MSYCGCYRLCSETILSFQAGDAATPVADAASRTITAESYLPPNPGPYPQDKPPENTVRFTPVQVKILKMIALMRPSGCMSSGSVLACMTSTDHPSRVPCCRLREASANLQVEAIRAGTQPGLTMVVGPPGTGKTDTAVQIMHVLYHNCPNQRTLLIAHSNQVHLTSQSRAFQSVHV